MLPKFRLRTVTPDEIVDNRDEIRPSVHPSNTLTESQNHHMRSSPPIQPGEQNFPGKLPSFSEVCGLAILLSQLRLVDLLSSSILHGLPRHPGLLSVGMIRLRALLMSNPSLTM